MLKRKIRKIGVGFLTGLLLVVLTYALLKTYFYLGNRAVHVAKATKSKEALARTVAGFRSSSPASALLREYRTTGALNYGISILDSPSPPGILIPLSSSMRHFLPDSGKDGIFYFVWLEYDFSVNGIVIEFSDGTAELYAVIPVWDASEREFFEDVVHKDYGVTVLIGPSKVESVLPKAPRTSAPLTGSELFAQCVCIWSTEEPAIQLMYLLFQKSYVDPRQRAIKQNVLAS